MHIGVEEFYYVMQGSGTARINDETAPITKGDAVPVLFNDVHSFENSGSADLEFLIVGVAREKGKLDTVDVKRSEEHTSELQSQSNLVCRLLLEKKKDTRLRGPALDRLGDPGAARQPGRHSAPRPAPAPGELPSALPAPPEQPDRPYPPADRASA